MISRACLPGGLGPWRRDAPARNRPGLAWPDPVWPEAGVAGQEAAMGRTKDRSIELAETLEQP